MPYAIKAEVADPDAETFAFPQHKTMYGGKLISAGDEVFVFASETAGGQGLIARGVVVSAQAHDKPPGAERWTPRVSVVIRRTAGATRPLGRRELKRFTDWADARSELNFKFYRQATDKIVGLSAEAAALLAGYF